jgi:Flp pilus assembly protein protease CpaA
MATKPTIANDAATVWVTRLVYLLVLIPVTAAAVLGVAKVKYFAPLVSAFPDDLRALLTVIVSAAIGGVAVFVRVQAARKATGRSAAAIKRSNQRSALLCLGVFLVCLTLVAFHLTSWVARVDYNGGVDTAQFVIGGRDRVPSCGCPAEVSAGECIEGLSFDKTKVESCWGDQSINRAKWILTVEYLFALLSISLAVAFLTLVEGKKHSAAERQALARMQMPKKPSEDPES